MTYLHASAVISQDGAYRYSLTRIWDRALVILAICGLNPSIADAEQDDPTIRREVGFAKAWGYGGIVKVNMFAFRATDPKVMRRAFDPVGPDNDAAIRSATHGRDVLCAWGAGGEYMARDRAVMELLADARSVMALGLTKDGHPRHPLYVAAATARTPFTVPHAA